MVPLTEGNDVMGAALALAFGLLSSSVICVIFSVGSGAALALLRVGCAVPLESPALLSVRKAIAREDLSLPILNSMRS